MAEIRKANGHRLEGIGGALEPEIEPARRPLRSDVEFDLEQVLGAVYAIETNVPEDAFTANALGTRRFGNAALISEDGLLLTIGYLVTEADQITLTDNSGKSIPGHVVGYDHDTGFGLVQAHETVKDAPVRRGAAADIDESETVVVAAHGGASNAQLTSVVSKRSFAGYWEYLLDVAIFTSPPHPSWSGAALLGRDGALCGVGSLYVQDALSAAGDVPGNMFVPLEILEPILTDLVTTGRSSRPPKPWLGMYTSEVEGALVVAGLADEAPASSAGIKVGDLIVAVAQEPVASLVQLQRRIRSVGDAGAIVNLQIYRDGSLLEVDVRSASRYDYLKAPTSH